ncbi:MAG: DtxR family transcriptional regulator, Mn-dependent transcriptional regulator [Actinomycetota bacterium]|nr:DtxR family transcriptional regulator, Mn-dependent transcriptional regulator [Actinomycetota bacterium]
MTSTSAAVEDYLKAVYVLGEEERDADGRSRVVATTALARRLGVSPPSATNMLKKLDALGLIVHSRYRGAELTPAGRALALEVIRHHRLLETYLATALGVPWDEVHEEAEVLEHVLSEGLEDRIAAQLGDPTADPHGHPIPRRDGRVPDAGQSRLWDLPVGATATVARVPDSDARTLRYLDATGIRPGTEVRVVAVGPVDGPLFVTAIGSAEERCALSKVLAESIWVAR